METREWSKPVIEDLYPGDGLATGFSLSGKMVATIEASPADFSRISVTGCKVEEQTSYKLVVSRPNAFVNQGLNAALDRIFNLTPPTEPTRIQLSNNTAAVTAATTTMGGTVSNKAISPAATRTLQTVTAGATFTQADVAFVITKVGLLNTSTDAGTGLYDIIGGTGGSAPYNQPFSIDLTGATSFSLTIQILVSASAS